MIARITALSLWVCFREAFKIGTRDIVEQDFVIDREHLSAAFR